MQDDGEDHRQPDRRLLPLAEDYIRKVMERGSVGKKRASARC